ncbi:MAG TPA: Rieske (2Fe-2S) protein [Gemmatimonadaceae bacterium]|jgi:nitrite reductase/ring-hydroxylating ferredoxin subunit
MTSSRPDCQSCPLAAPPDDGPSIERRELLRAAAAVLASLGLLSLSGRDAGAMPVRMLRALAAHGSERRDVRYPIAGTDGVSIDKDNSVILARAAGKVYAFSLACPHQNTALRWDEGDHEFRCPKHKSRYRDDGTFIDGRATRAMDRLAVRRDGDVLVVDVERMFKQDENPAEWASAFVSV